MGTGYLLDSDAIIAATALTENFVLVTRNTADFKNIPGLELLNPWEAEAPPSPVTSRR
jgi:predicted nucleic acid-binding protein